MAVTTILNVDVFAWRPGDIVGIDPRVVVHKLNIKPDAKPVKKKRRIFSAQLDAIVQEEVERLLRI